MTTLEELQRRAERLEKQISKKKKEQAALDKKRKKYVLSTVGKLVMNYTPEKDWKQLDLEAFSEFLNSNSEDLASVFNDTPLDSETVYKKARAFERANRRTKKEKETIAANTMDGENND